MTGDELEQWVATLTQATVAYDLKRDDLAKAMAELTPDEKEKVLSDMRGVAAFISGVAHFLTMLMED